MTGFGKINGACPVQVRKIADIHQINLKGKMNERYGTSSSLKDPEKCVFRVFALFFCDNGHGRSRNTNQFVLLICNFDVPNHSCTSFMYSGSSGSNLPITFASYLIRI